MLLGCIGDDFTGSSDIANTLARGGMRTTLFSGVPKGPTDGDVEAGIIALKSRTEPVADAVAKSLAAADWLVAQGCQQVVFKVCSTFDSTKEGNVGPVAEALADRLGEDRIVVCPAFPATGRSVYRGHLFVNDALLSESGMQNHPLTPMTDPDIRRWLSHQTAWPVEHIGTETVFRGVDALRKDLGRGEAAMVVIDAIRDDDLFTIARAASDRKLLVGGSGIALGLPSNFGERHAAQMNNVAFPGADGVCVVLSGSCSEATRRQVAVHGQHHASLEIDINRVMAGDQTADQIAAWLLAQQNAVPMAYSSADPGTIAKAQERYGQERSAIAVENLFVSVARTLVDAGVCKIVTAGGETSGAVVEGLNLSRLDIGPEIAPGVPAVRDPVRRIGLALKSGNFGQDDFFERAASVLTQGSNAGERAAS
ncbi:MAG: 3-oxo-tetronate kinase [Pseudomonadota bacterium]